jgi:hypothetical protein
LLLKNQGTQGQGQVTDLLEDFSTGFFPNSCQLWPGPKARQVTGGALSSGDRTEFETFFFPVPRV